MSARLPGSCRLASGLRHHPMRPGAATQEAVTFLFQCRFRNAVQTQSSPGAVTLAGTSLRGGLDLAHLFVTRGPEGRAGGRATNRRTAP